MISFHLRPCLLKLVENFLKYSTFGTISGLAAQKKAFPQLDEHFWGHIKMLYRSLISAWRPSIWAINDPCTLCFILDPSPPESSTPLLLQSLDNKLLLTDYTAQVALPPMVRPASGFFLPPSFWDIWGIDYISVASFGYITIYRAVNINNGWLSKSPKIS